MKIYYKKQKLLNDKLNMGVNHLYRIIGDFLAKQKTGCFVKIFDELRFSTS